MFARKKQRRQEEDGSEVVSLTPTVSASGVESAVTSNDGSTAGTGMEHVLEGVDHTWDPRAQK